MTRQRSGLEQVSPLLAPSTVVSVVVVLVAVELVTRLGVVDPLFLIPATDALIEAAKLLGQGEYWRVAVWPTLRAILVGYGLAASLGMGVGLVLWRFPGVRKRVSPWISAYYAVPLFAGYPVLVGIFGLGMKPIVILAVLYGVVVIIEQTAAGLDDTPAVYEKMAKTHGLSGITAFYRLYLPAALPAIMGSLRLGLVYVSVSVIGTEFILSTQGLGREISHAYEAFQIERLYGGIVVVMLLAFALNVMLDLATFRALRGSRRSISWT